MLYENYMKSIIDAIIKKQGEIDNDDIISKIIGKKAQLHSFSQTGTNKTLTPQ